MELTSEQKAFFELVTKEEPLHAELADYVTDGPIGAPMIKHPLIIELFFDPARCAMINTRYHVKKEKIERMLADRKWSDYVMMHERPFRLDALLHVLARGLREESPEIIGDVLHQVWTDSENIFENFELWYELFEDVSLAAAWRASMDDEERAKLASLPEKVTIYRGFKHSESMSGFSWTLRRTRAMWFANRWKRNDDEPKVATGTVHRDDILAYYSGRNEDEVVVFPDVVEIQVVDRV